MNLKQTIVKAICAIICVAILCVSIVSAIGTYTTAQIEAVKGTASSGALDAEELPYEESIADQMGSEDAGTVSDGTENSGEVAGEPSEDGSTPQQPGEDGKTDAANPNAGAAAATPSAEPKTPIEVLNYYNNAVSKAVSAKVGFSKTRTTDNETMDGSIGLQAMKSLVYKFMGIGAENAYTVTVTKAKWGDVAFLANSKLAATDVTAANIAKSGDNYVITLKLKSGASSASQSNPTTAANAALDKCGICVGTEDKGYFDHKTASVIYDAIAGTYAGAEVKESYTNATVKATINASTGNLVNLVVEWNQSVTLSKLLGMSATATGVSHVTYKDFKY